MSTQTAQPDVGVRVPGRRRDAADSRRRLLAAAGELFADRGYERTTVREVGQRAGVDPALIARYFGGKSALYLESLFPDRGQAARTEPIDVTDASRMQALFGRVLPNSPTPTFFAAVRPHADDELQEAAMALLRRRVIDPAAEVARSQPFPDAQLRAEIVAAALAGVLLSRTSGALDALSGARPDQVGALVAQMLSQILGATSSLGGTFFDDKDEN